MLAHGIDIRHHDPVVGIDEHFHEPAVDLIRIHFAQEQKTTEEHEPFDVMAIASVENPTDAVVDGTDAGFCRVETIRQRVVMCFTHLMTCLQQCNLKKTFL